MESIERNLTPAELLSFIKIAEKELGLDDLEVELEYQNDTIGRYQLFFDTNHFVLKNKKTHCFAEDVCGIPSAKKKVHLSEIIINKKINGITDSGCC